MTEKISLIAGTANRPLAEEISTYLDVPLTPVEIKHFNDGETYAHIQKSVRGSIVFVIQPTSPPVNSHLMELLLIIDALKRASAKEITAVVPYYGYSRQDRKAQPREPISARLVANMIEKAGADRLVTFDLHADQIQGFFDIPVDNLEAHPILAEHILDLGIRDAIVVAPDVGGAKRARRLAQLLNTNLAIIDKRRPAHGKTEVLNIVGEVKGKNCILADDIIDTAGTISGAAKALKHKGAKDVYVCATHALFSGNAVEKLSIPEIKKVIITNSIFLEPQKRFSQLTVISLASILAESINTIFEGKAMGLVFDRLYHKVEEKRHP
ncbi:ribose-phosphate pyrophosphokinase [Candidatus Woesearchaeota archaeon]|nr:ribose-phosphate pyrophosphokinase [Candidatus Woesearchaeota archaeon]